ncbi:MAG: M23 family metallopeptidase [Propionibacteriaceae bacterium]
MFHRLQSRRHMALLAGMAITASIGFGAIYGQTSATAYPFTVDPSVASQALQISTTKTEESDTTVNELAARRYKELQTGALQSLAKPELVEARNAALSQFHAQLSSAAQSQELTKLMNARGAQEQSRRRSPEKSLITTLGARGVLSHETHTSNIVIAPMKAGTYQLTASYGQTGLWFPYHSGQDFAAPTGTPVYAIVDGVIGHEINDFWAGNHVVLYHGDGGASLYAHLSATTVKPGQIVHAGDVIGYVGNTGRSFGAHLHFEIYPTGAVPGDNIKCINPVTWLSEHKVSV